MVVVVVNGVVFMRCRRQTIQCHERLRHATLFTFPYRLRSNFPFLTDAVVPVLTTPFLILRVVTKEGRQSKLYHGGQKKNTTDVDPTNDVTNHSVRTLGP
jgi:hypothetical protein